jgi:hypothetical protein
MEIFVWLAERVLSSASRRLSAAVSSFGGFGCSPDNESGVEAAWADVPGRAESAVVAAFVPDALEQPERMGSRRSGRK